MSEVSTNLLIEMRALARQANGLEPGHVEQQPQESFGTVLADMVDTVNEKQQHSKALQTDFTMEKPGVELVDAMLAMQEARLHFQSMVQIRNHLVQAYEEIMRMPV